MPKTKQQAWNDAKKTRDKEFNQRDKEIKKWKMLYADWEALVKAGDITGARAKNTELSKQGQIVAKCMAVIDGKLEAMTELQAAATLQAADAAIKDLIDQELAALFELLQFLVGFPQKKPSLLKKDEDAIERAYITMLQIKGKREIAAVCH